MTLRFKSEKEFAAFEQRRRDDAAEHGVTVPTPLTAPSDAQTFQPSFTVPPRTARSTAPSDIPNWLTSAALLGGLVLMLVYALSLLLWGIGFVEAAFGKVW